MTKERIEAALCENRGNISGSAKALGMGRTAFSRLGKEFGLIPWLSREKGRMAELLQLTHGNLTRSAALYGMTTHGFRNKAKRLGLLPWPKKAA